MTIFVTLTRGEAVRGGVSGDDPADRQRDLSPAPDLAADPPPRFSESDLEQTRISAEIVAAHFLRRWERDFGE